MTSGFDRVVQAIRAYRPAPPFWEKNPAEIFVYGTGTMGRDVCQILLKRGLPVNGFLDHARRSNLFAGMPVSEPGDEQIPSEIRARANIVLAIHNPFADVVGIIKRLSSLGYAHIISPVELYDYLGDALGVRYWLVSRKFYQSLEAMLEQAYSLWADDISREVYTAILEHRLTGNYEALPPVDWEHRYAPADIPAWKDPLRLIDCGAFNGDSILDLQKAKLNFAAIAAFEPDLATFQKLVIFFREHRELCREVTVWPCGIFSSTTQMRFNANQSDSSALSETGDVAVQCVSLDDVLPDFTPNLIKMDIEGAEYEALLGARKLIVEHLPGLAISLYHRPEHLWQIPLLIKRLAANVSGNYRYYLRPHENNGYDLVFYAVPVGRP